MDSLEIPSLNFKTQGSIPQIGFGTFELNGKDCQNGVKCALKMGYRHIDTASVYRNETDINKIINDKSLNIHRN